MTKKLFSIVFMFVIICFAYSEEGDDLNVDDSVNVEEVKNAFELYPNALGVYGCYPITGGFSYHRWFDKFGLQITGGGVVTSDLYADYNLQVQLQGMVYGADITSWFATAFYPFGIIGHRGYNWYGKEDFTYSYHVGGGFGVELLFMKHLSLTMDVFIAGMYPWRLTMGGGGSLRFRF